MSIADVAIPRTPDNDSSPRLDTVELGGEPAMRTAIILDWDDTLLSSSWLAQNGLRLDGPDVVPAEAWAQLMLLQNSVIALIEKASQYGEIVIITNAETGWVELSAKKFLPGVLPFLSKFQVVSARSAYETAYPDSPSEWKVQAFEREISRCFAHCPSDMSKNVVSLGDSIHERAAVQKVCASMSKAITKSVKFVERPTVEQLKRQVDLVTTCFQDIVGHKGHLDLMLTIQLLYQN